MADFNIALAELLTFEGGYSNNAADSGGETYAGVTRRFNPQWLGWSLIDPIKRSHSNLVELNAALKADPQVSLAVSQFYKQKYWNFDLIPSQSVANKMFEIDVNFGPSTAVRFLQQGLTRLGYVVGVDGSLGKQTLIAAGQAKEPDLLHALRAYSALHRVHRVLAQPDQVQFIEGWLWRDTA